MNDQVPIPVYLWWMLMALAICGLLAAALWFIRLAINLLSWRIGRKIARADEVAKLGLRRCPLCGRMKAKDGEHKCPQSPHAAGMGPYPPRIVEVDPMAEERMKQPEELCIRCRNRVRKWWSLWFKVRCNDSMQPMSAPPCDEVYCPSCGNHLWLPPMHFNCRCTMGPIAGKGATGQ